jgi:peptidoglycan/LPS O-acetylase OafA/YrhL
MVRPLLRHMSLDRSDAQQLALPNQAEHRAGHPVGKDFSYRSDIDGLRAIAVLSVFAFHLAPDQVSGGFVGVDIFFVISGFLISSIIYKELESGTFSIVEFYVRRIRRIYPALGIVLAFVCVAGWLILLPREFVQLGKQIVGGSTFVANFVLWVQSGYFSSDAVRMPLLHLWSLGVEEQFYLMFPLICIIFYRAKSRFNLPAAFLAIAIASMVLNVAMVAKYNEATFFLPLSRLWELFLGAGLALFRQRRGQTQSDSKPLQRWRTAIGLAGLALLAGAIFGITEADPFPGWWALLPTLGTVLVIAAGEDSWANRHILSSKPAVFVGLISYPLYLWHWPIISFLNSARLVWGFLATDRQIWGVDLSDVWGGTVTVFASFALATLTYRFVELPLRKVKERESRRKGALWMLGFVLMIGAFGALVVVEAGFPSRVPAAMAALDHDYASDASLAYRDGTCFLRPYQSQSAFSDSCLDPAAAHASGPFVLVWGDSHAADLVPGFRALQHQSGVRLAQYTASGCAPILGMKVGIRPLCKSINDAVLDRIKILKPDIVVLSARWDLYNDWDVDHDRYTRAEKLLHTIQSIKSAGVRKVVVIGSAPMWRTDVPTLLFNEVRRNPSVPVAHRLARSLVGAHDDSLIIATAQRGGAIFIPLFDRLCDPDSCLATDGPDWQDVVTADTAHFTEHGSLRAAQSMWSSIVDDGGVAQN